MSVPYTNQAKAVSRLRPGEYIMFRERSACDKGASAVNSAEVVTFNDVPLGGVVLTLDNVNGLGQSLTVDAASIELMRDPDWPDVL